MATPVNQRKAMLTDMVWAALLEQSALEDTSASALCEYVLRHYLNLPDDEKPPILIASVAQTAVQRTIYIKKPLWATAKGRKVMERRSISAILEQQLRAYMGLDMPESKDI
jgi:hypothetical protein